MYQSYWKLNCLPFENSFAPQYFYRSASHQTALLKLRYCITSQQGVALLAGDTGLGKSYLVAQLMQELTTKRDADSISFLPVPILYPRLSPSEFLSYIVGQLDALAGTTSNADRGLDQTVATLARQLKTLSETNTQPIIVIDEAQLIDSQDVWDCLLLLQNCQQAENVRLSILLVGDYSLLTRVSKMPAWNERVSLRGTVTPLTPAETAAYIRHRLTIAESTDNIFETSALQAVYKFSEGIPRRINRLCDMSLLVGFADSLPKITASEIEAVADELLPTIAV